LPGTLKAAIFALQPPGIRGISVNSRSMPLGGSGVKLCAGRIIEKAKKIADEIMEVAAEDPSYEGGSFVVPGTEIAPLAFPKVARMAHVGHVLPAGMERGLDETVFKKEGDLELGCASAVAADEQPVQARSMQSPPAATPAATEDRPSPETIAAAVGGPASDAYKPG
jgi:CO/xanthine dehydrogenase Mo-binding subunit